MAASIDALSKRPVAAAPVQVPIATGGSIDTTAVMAMIQNLQIEVNLKANSSDLDSIRTALNGKADKTAVKSEVDRLDKAIADVRNKFNEMNGLVSKMSKDTERLNQYMEMLQKQIKNLQSTPQ
jgi:chromosome segregation ATPase